jgi:hypothetical protein
MHQPPDPSGGSSGKRDPALTPIMTTDDSILLVTLTPAMRLACVELAMRLGLRPIIATQATMTQIAASSRPLVLVMESDPSLDHEKIMDLVVSIGAQVVYVTEGDSLDELTQRASLAVTAARTRRTVG